VERKWGGGRRRRRRGGWTGVYSGMHPGSGNLRGCADRGDDESEGIEKRRECRREGRAEGGARVEEEDVVMDDRSRYEGEDGALAATCQKNRLHYVQQQNRNQPARNQKIRTKKMLQKKKRSFINLLIKNSP